MAAKKRFSGTHADRTKRRAADEARKRAEKKARLQAKGLTLTPSGKVKATG